MLSTVVVGTDPRMVNYLRQVCAEFTNICVYKTLPLNTRPREIALAMSHYTPDVVFLVIAEADTVEVASVLKPLQDILLTHPTTALIPVMATPEGLWLHHRPLGLSVSPALVCPFSAEEFEKAIFLAMDRKPAASKQRGHLLAVVPSKPGSGASTVALNVAGAMANQFGKKTLLIEGDFCSGSLPMLLNLNPEEYVAQGIGDPNLLTEASWSRAVLPACGMDVLPANPSPHVAKGTLWDYHRLLHFARERYGVVVVDISNVVDEAAAAVTNNSDRVYMVSTPDPASLSLIGRRLWELEREGIRANHVESVLNRYAEEDAPVAELSARIRRPFIAVLPEDARGVKEATRSYRLVAAKAPFGREAELLARRFLEAVDPRQLPPAPQPSLRKLVINALGL